VLRAGGAQFSSFGGWVAQTVRNAPNLTWLTQEGGWAVKVSNYFKPALREAAKTLAETAAAETVEAAALEAAAVEATEAGVESLGWRAAVRFGAKRVVAGALGIVGVALTIYTVWQIGSAVWHWARPSSRTTANQPCPTLVLEYRRCPWTPQDASVQPCPPGFCWDGGFQGSLACKQEEAPPNSHRGSLYEVICDDGYVAEQDPCTHVIARCVKSWPEAGDRGKGLSG
jgi:hypothetical protein